MKLVELVSPSVNQSDGTESLHFLPLKSYEMMIQLQKLHKIGYSWKAWSQLVPMNDGELWL